MTDDLHDLNEKLKRSAEEFSLTPSAGVWKNVEKEIHPRQRTRRLIFVLAGLLMLSGALTWMLNSPAKPQPTADNVNQHAATAPAANEGESAPENGVAASTVDPQDITGNPVAKEEVMKNVSPGNSQPDEWRDVTNKNRSPEQARVNHNETTDHAPGKGRREEREPADHAMAEANGMKTAQSPLPEPEPTSFQKADIANDNTLLTRTISEADTVTPIDTTHIVKADPVSLPVVVSAGENNTTVNDSVPSSASGRFSVSIGVMPSWSLTTFTEKGDYDFVANWRDSTERDLPSMNFHFDFGYTFESTYVYSGLRLVNYRTKMPARQAVYRYDQGPVTGPTPPPVVVSRGFDTINNDPDGMITNQLMYLGVPVGIRTHLYTYRRIRFAAQFEFTCYRLIKTQGYFYDYSTHAYKSMGVGDLRSWNWSSRVALHAEYAFNDRFAAALSPTCTGFGSIYKRDYPLKQRFSPLGVELSLHYTF